MYALRLTAKALDGWCSRRTFIPYLSANSVHVFPVLALACPTSEYPTSEYPTPRGPTVGPPKECGHELGLHKSWTHP